jgi:hypothetical protein
MCVKNSKEMLGLIRKRYHFFKVLVQIPYSQANTHPLYVTYKKNSHFMPKTALINSVQGVYKHFMPKTAFHA